LPLGMLLMYITIILTIPDRYYKNRNLLQNRVSWTIVRVLSVVVIIWAHQFTSTIIFVLILMFEIIYYIISKNNANKLSFHYSIFYLYIVMLLAHWIFVSSVLPSLVNVFDVYYTSLFTAENYQVAASSL